MQKINLGCGIRVAEGWVNIDNSFYITISRKKPLKYFLYKVGLIDKKLYDIRYPSNILRRDLRKKLPFKTESTDFIYSSHFLEHISYKQAKILLFECNRILKTGGLIRIVVPDLKWLATEYSKGNIDAEKVLQAFTIYSEEQKIILSEKIFPFLFSKDHHKWMYDYESLSKLLEDTGFKEVRQKSFQEGKVPDCDQLDNNPEGSLFVEAQK